MSAWQWGEFGVLILFGLVLFVAAVLAVVWLVAILEAATVILVAEADKRRPSTPSAKETPR